MAKAHFAPIKLGRWGSAAFLVLPATPQLNGSSDECTSESFDHVLQLAWPLAKCVQALWHVSLTHAVRGVQPEDACRMRTYSQTDTSSEDGEHRLFRVH